MDWLTITTWTLGLVALALIVTSYALSRARWYRLHNMAEEVRRANEWHEW